MKATKIVYSLRHKATGKLMGVESSSNKGYDFCGDTTYKFASYSDNVYETESISAIVRAKTDDCHWYNSTKDCPCWGGGDDLNDYEIIEVTKVVEETSKVVILPEFIDFQEAFGKDYYFDGVRSSLKSYYILFNKSEVKVGDFLSRGCFPEYFEITSLKESQIEDFKFKVELEKKEFDLSEYQEKEW